MSACTGGSLPPLVNLFGLTEAHESLDFAIRRLEEKWGKLEGQLLNLGIAKDTDMPHPDVPSTVAYSDLGKVYEGLYHRIMATSIQIEALQDRLDI